MNICIRLPLERDPELTSLALLRISRYKTFVSIDDAYQGGEVVCSVSAAERGTHVANSLIPPVEGTARRLSGTDRQSTLPIPQPHQSAFVSCLLPSKDREKGFHDHLLDLLPTKPPRRRGRSALPQQCIGRSSNILDSPLYLLGAQALAAIKTFEAHNVPACTFGYIEQAEG